MDLVAQEEKKTQVFLLHVLFYDALFTLALLFRRMFRVDVRNTIQLAVISVVGVTFSLDLKGQQREREFITYY